MIVTICGGGVGVGVGVGVGLGVGVDVDTTETKNVTTLPTGRHGLWLVSCICARIIAVPPARPVATPVAEFNVTYGHALCQ